MANEHPAHTLPEDYELGVWSLGPFRMKAKNAKNYPYVLWWMIHTPHLSPNESYSLFIIQSGILTKPFGLAALRRYLSSELNLRDKVHLAAVTEQLRISGYHYTAQISEIDNNEQRIDCEHLVNRSLYESSAGSGRCPAFQQCPRTDPARS